MPGWKTALVGFLALAGPAFSHSHHDNDETETVPEDRRAELLHKWEQEVSFSLSLSIHPFSHLNQTVNS